MPKQSKLALSFSLPTNVRLRTSR